ncbi:MAG: hypothetical protein SH857_08595 [Chitinophagales bacterium]|nr:hypothetical protein [Chitinophagales bacterium]
MLSIKTTIEELQKQKAPRENRQDNIRSAILEKEKRGEDCKYLKIKLEEEEFYISQIEAEIKSYRIDSD